MRDFWSHFLMMTTPLRRRTRHSLNYCRYDEELAKTVNCDQHEWRSLMGSLRWCNYFRGWYQHLVKRQYCMIDFTWAFLPLIGKKVQEVMMAGTVNGRSIWPWGSDNDRNNPSRQSKTAEHPAGNALRIHGTKRTIPSCKFSPAKRSLKF